MKVLYIILGVWILVTGVLTIAGVCEMDQFTAGLYALCLGIMTLTEGISAWRKKQDVYD